MLQAIRSKATKWVVGAVVILLFFGFLILDLSSYYQGGGNSRNTIATVYGESISVSVAQSALQNRVNELQNLLRQPVTPAMIRQANLPEIAVNDIIKKAFLTKLATDAKLSAPPELIAKLIAAEPSLQNSSGQLDPEKFKQLLQARGMNEKTLISELQLSFTTTKLLDGLGKLDGTDDVIARWLALADAQQRQVKGYHITPARVVLSVEPTADTLTKHYAASPLAFTIPEQRSITLLEFNPQKIGRTITVTDRDIERVYNDNSEQFKTPERRSIRQVVVSDAATAQTIYNNALASKTLTADGTTASVQTVEEATKESLVPDLAEKIFALNKGDILPPTQTPFGWHVVQVLEKLPAGVQSIESVRPQLEAYAKAQLAQDAYNRLLSDLEADTAAGKNLKSLPPHEAFSIKSYSDLTPKSELFLALPPIVQDAVINQNTGEISPLLSGTEGNIIYLVQVDSITPSRLQDFASVQDQIKESWQTEQRRAKALEIAADLRQALQTNQPATVPSGVEVISPITLRITDTQLPVTVVENVFNTALNNTAVTTLAEDIYVLQVQAITNPATVDEAQLKAAKEGAAKVSINSAFLLLFEQAKADGTITINTEALERLYPN